MKEIICVTTYPPRECGIATFSDDLIRAIEMKFGYSFTVKVCALEARSEQYVYDDKVKYVLNTSEADEFPGIAREMNEDPKIKLVLIQHEFGLFGEHENEFLAFTR